jgi:hypothetical protein
VSSEPRRGERASLDQTLKRLLIRSHDGFLALVAPGLAWRGELSPELPAGARQADLVWEVARPDGRHGILHIELQTRVEADIGERVAEYVMRLWRRDHVPIRSVVVFLREARTTPASPFVIPWGPEETLICRYEVVRLWELPQERVLATPHYGLWPLASLMAGVSVGSTEAVAQRLIGAPLPEEERRELAGQLLLLAANRLPTASILEALRRNPMLDDLLEDNSVAQYLREQGERRMARVALEGRFGPLGADVVAALETADPDTLRTLVAHVTTDTLEQMRARLGLG